MLPEIGQDRAFGKAALDRHLRVPIPCKPLDQLHTSKRARADEEATGTNILESRPPKCLDQPVTIELVVVSAVLSLDPAPCARFETLHGLRGIARGKELQHQRN